MWKLWRNPSLPSACSYLSTINNLVKKGSFCKINKLKFIIYNKLWRQEMVWTRWVLEHKWFYSKYNWRICLPIGLEDFSSHSSIVFSVLLASKQYNTYDTIKYNFYKTASPQSLTYSNVPHIQLVLVLENHKACLRRNYNIGSLNG